MNQWTKENIQDIFYNCVDEEIIDTVVEVMNEDPSKAINIVLRDIAGTGNDYLLKGKRKEELKNAVEEFAQAKLEWLSWQDVDYGMSAYGDTQKKAKMTLNKLNKLLPLFDGMTGDKPIQLASSDTKLAKLITGKDMVFYGKGKCDNQTLQAYLSKRYQAIKLLKDNGVIKPLTEGVPGIISGLYALNTKKIEHIKYRLTKWDIGVPDLEGEEWRPILEDPSAPYRVSNMGRVKSLNYHNSGVENLMKPTLNTYFLEPVLKVTCGKTLKGKSVHRMVWEAFVGIKASKTAYFEHIDGDPYNCRLENIKLIDNEETADWQDYKDECGEANKEYWENVRRRNLYENR